MGKKKGEGAGEGRPLIVFMGREDLAWFMLMSCPMANRRLFVSESAIQVDGLDRSGKRVVRRMLAFPNGRIVDVDMRRKKRGAG